MTKEEKKIIFRQRAIALLCPPEQAMKIIEPYSNLDNYLNPEYEPEQKAINPPK